MAAATGKHRAGPCSVASAGLLPPSSPLWVDPARLSLEHRPGAGSRTSWKHDTLRKKSPPLKDSRPPPGRGPRATVGRDGRMWLVGKQSTGAWARCQAARDAACCKARPDPGARPCPPTARSRGQRAGGASHCLGPGIFFTLPAQGHPLKKPRKRTEACGHRPSKNTLGKEGVLQKWEAGRALPGAAQLPTLPAIRWRIGDASGRGTSREHREAGSVGTLTSP